jgi:hypothetical protein
MKVEPLLSWYYVVMLLSFIAAALAVLKGVRAKKKNEVPFLNLGPTKAVRKWVLGFTVGAAICFNLALINPVKIGKGMLPAVRLIVVFDISDSVLRAQEGWEKVRRDAAQSVSSFLAPLSRQAKFDGNSRILAFRNKITGSGEFSLKELPRQIEHLKKGIAGGEGTDIEAALLDAGDFLKSGGQQAILLISDGNQTTGDALSAARKLGERGIPIHVFPITGGPPALGIFAADLPRYTNADAPANLRVLFSNKTPKPETGRFSIQVNGKGLDEPGADESGKKGFQSIKLEKNRLAYLSLPITFKRFGLQYVDAVLALDRFERKSRRRYFTLVKDLPRILAIGGPNHWIEAIPADVAKIIQKSPQQLSGNFQWGDFDAIVIDSVPSIYLKGVMKTIARRVKRYGAGLMVLNGSHGNTDIKTETVLASYKDTPLAPLLPLNGDTKSMQADPPGYRIAILIDTSSSMGSGMGGSGVLYIEKAREVAAAIVKKLRRKDKLNLIAFTTGAEHTVQNMSMDAEGKTYTLQQIDKIEAYGGTDPREALAMVNKLKMGNCVLVFISDGEFGMIDARPDCMTSVFWIGGMGGGYRRVLEQLSNHVVEVRSNFDTDAITLPFLDPQKELKYFQPGRYSPISTGRQLEDPDDRLPVPSIPLEGSAISTLNEDVVPVLNAVRPKYAYPLLAFCKIKKSYVGAFTTGITGRWTNSKEGKKAITAWIRRLLPVTDRDRYDFKLLDAGHAIKIEVALVPKKGRIPRVESLEAKFAFKGEGSVDVSLKSDTGAPGVWSGVLKVLRGDRMRAADLILMETGMDALPKPQRIPISIPPKIEIQGRQTSEDFTEGQNRQLLREIAFTSGGIYSPTANDTFPVGQATGKEKISLWKCFAILGALLYLVSIWLSRWKP